MSGSRDEFLESAFARAEQPLVDPGLAETVLQRARSRRLWRLGLGLTVVAALALVAWLSLGVTLLQFGLLFSELVTQSLVDLGEGWLALLLMPLNSVGGLLAIMTKAGLALRKRFLNASFGA